MQKEEKRKLAQKSCGGDIGSKNTENKDNHEDNFLPVVGPYLKLQPHIQPSLIFDIASYSTHFFLSLIHFKR